MIILEKRWEVYFISVILQKQSAYLQIQIDYYKLSQYITKTSHNYRQYLHTQQNKTLGQQIKFLFLFFNNTNRHLTMYKPKAQQFRKQIRRQYLNQYFKKKRKEFTQITQPQQTVQMQTIQRLNKQIHESLLNAQKMIPEKGTMGLEDLSKLAKLSQTQHGVECLSRTEIPILVLPFMGSSYYNRPQQHLATCIFVNITYLKTQKLPTHQFLRKITNIIQSTQTHQQSSQQNYSLSTSISNDQLLDTIDNSLLIIYHLMVDFGQQVVRFYVEECDLVGLLYRMLESSAGQQIVEKLLKIMTQVNLYFSNKKDKRPVRKFLKFYITIFENINAPQFIYLSLANIQALMKIYCEAINSKNHNTYQKSSPTQAFSDTEKQYADIQGQIQKSRFLHKIKTLYPYISQKKSITKILLVILRMLCPGLSLKSIEQHIFKLLEKMIEQLYEHQVMKDKEQESMQAYSNLRTEFYQVVYQILSVWTNNHDSFTKSGLYHKICQRFQEFEEISSSDFRLNHSVRKNFIHIFGMLTLSGNLNQKQNQLLKISIQRYRSEKEMSENHHSEQDQQQERFIHMVQGHFDDMNDSRF